MSIFFIKIQVTLYQKSVAASQVKMVGKHRSFFPDCKKTHQILKKNLPHVLSFILAWETCFHVTVVIDTKPKVKGELQTVIENSANFIKTN